MKSKISVIIMLVMLIAVLSSCGYAAAGFAYASDTIGYGDYYDAVTAISGHSGYDSDFGDAQILVRTYQEFLSFMKSPEMVAASPSFLNAAEKYDEEYFQNNYLVFIADWQPSGSISLRIKDVVIENESINVVTEALVPEIGTCDMSLWIFLIEIQADPQISNITYTCNQVNR